MFRSWIPAAVGFVIFVSACLWWFSGESEDDVRQQATRLLVAGEFEAALDVAEAYLHHQNPTSAHVLLIAGKASRQLNRFDDAVRFFQRVPETDESERLLALLNASEVYLDDLHRLSSAEACLQEVLEADPNHLAANHLMSVVLGLQSRNREMVPHLLRLVRAGQFDEKILYLLAMTEDFWFTPDDIRRYHEAAPQDPGPLVTLARFSIMKQQYDVAESLLRTAIHAAPAAGWVSVRLGELFHASGNQAAFLRWRESLPAAHLERADICAVIGAWHRDNNEASAAAEYLWRAVAADPQNRLVHYQLGQVLKSLGHVQEARRFEDRFRLLDEYFLAVHFMREGRGDFLSHVVRATELAAELGRDWEAIGWFQIAQRRQVKTDWSQRVLHLSAVKWRQRTLRRSEPGTGLAWTIEKPEFPSSQSSVITDSVRTPDAVPQIPDLSFADVADDVGLIFRYESGSRPESRGPERMFEMTGGGIAIFDCDRDGWPDMYLSQGSPDGPSENGQPSSAAPYDEVVRNVRGERFLSVGHLVGTLDQSYSQGVTSGDFNNDGFPDVYVCNIGINRLYLNNGDGTLSEVNRQVGDLSDRWSTSAVIADVSGDGLPDIYVANYLEGDGVLDRTCRSPEQFLVTCPPTDFEAASDRLLINSGDGRFSDASEDAGINVDAGRGLGVVTTDFDADGRLDIYVANDQTPNFLFVRRKTDNEGDGPRFEEIGIPSSTALNADGRPEAGMGVAVDDVDGNGLADLFVTNFQDESNTLMLQIAPMIFSDMTRVYDLAAPTLPMLGFGTQFLDADLDGRPDLLTVNGHIRFDLEHFRMAPQLFYNTGDRFELLDQRRLGSWFRRRQLGRSAATLDWDSDGDDDVAVGHLDTPYALVENQSANLGRWMKLRLIGTDSSRDAVGSVATLRTPGRTLTRQCSKGGYHSSSEPVLTFGLSRERQIEELQIKWISGNVERYSVPRTNTHYAAVEGVGLFDLR